MTRSVKKLALRFGVALSLLAAASIFVHAAEPHIGQGGDNGACASCRVVAPAPAVASSDAVRMPVAPDAPLAVSLPPFVSSFAAPRSGRGPPSR